MKAYRCLDSACGEVFTHEDALKRTRGLSIFIGCPYCPGLKGHEDVLACNDCLVVAPLDDDGNCPHCSDDIALADLEHAEDEGRKSKGDRSKLALVARNGAMVPYRQAS